MDKKLSEKKLWELKGVVEKAIRHAELDMEMAKEQGIETMRSKTDIIISALKGLEYECSFEGEIALREDIDEILKYFGVKRITKKMRDKIESVMETYGNPIWKEQRMTR